LLLFFKKEVLAYFAKARKDFFFEKKKQKTFAPFGGAAPLDPLYILYIRHPSFVS